MDVGTITATVKATADAFKSTIEGVKKGVQDMAKETKEQTQKASQAANEIANSSKKVADGSKTMISQFTAVSIAASAAFIGMIKGISDVVTVTNQFNNSLLGLKSTSGSLNIDLNKVTKAAQDLSNDGLMTVSDAATGLKNLLLAGFGLDQAVTLMQRFKDSAAFGRQASLSFGQAITSATEGIKNGNSILVDNAGVTKNLSVMLEEAGYSAQDLMKASTDAGVRQAIFNGILKETAHQSGDAAKLSNTLSGEMSQFTTQSNLAKVAVGNALTPTIQEFYSVLGLATRGITNFANAHPEAVAGMLKLTVSITGAIAIFSLFTVVGNKAREALKMLNLELLKSPWGWAALAVAAVVTIIYKLIAANQEAKRLQEQYNKTLEETNRIRQDGIQVSEISQRQEEIKQLTPLIDKYKQYLDTLEKVKQAAAKGENYEAVTPNATVYAATEQEMKKLDKQLLALGYSYDTARQRVDALTEAIQKAKMMDMSEVQTKVQEYQQYTQTNSKLLESISLYQELSNKKSLTAKESEQLASTTKALIDIFGEDIISRRNVNGTIDLSISALSKEKKALQDNANEHKKSVEDKIKEKQQEIDAEIQRVQTILGTIDIEKKAYTGLYKQREDLISDMKETDPDDPYLYKLGNFYSRVNAQIEQYEGQIGELKSALNDLAGQRLSLDTATTGQDKINYSGSSNSDNQTNKALQDALSIYEYKKHLNQLSLQDEVNMLEKIKANYAKTAEEQRQLDMQIYDVKKEITQKEIEDAQTAFESSKENIENRAEYNNMALEDELKAWEKLRDQYAKDSEFYKQADQEVYKVRKELNEKYVSEINDLNSEIKDALRQRYEDEQKKQEDTLNQELDNLDDWKDQSEQRINDVYDTKIKAIEDAATAQEKALQDEIDALEAQEKQLDRADQDAEELKTINQLKASIEYEHNEFNKAELQKQLDTAIANRQKRLNKEAIDDKKDSLQNQIDVIRNNADKQKELLEEQRKAELNNITDIYNAQKANLEQQLKDIQIFYTAKLTDASLEAESERLIMDNNQKDIITLLHSYEPDYQMAGQSLGEKLVAGFKPQIDEIRSMIDSIYAQIAAARSSALSAMNAANKISTSNTNGNATSSAVSKTAVFNTSLTVTSPTPSPAETSRQVENSMRKLGYQWGLA